MMKVARICNRATVVGALLTALLGCQPSEPIEKPSATIKHIKPPALFRAPQPPTPTFDTTPLPEFAAIRDTQAKKGAFFGYMAPLIDNQNSYVEALQKHIRILASLVADQGELHPDDQQWLDRLAKKHRIDAPYPEKQLQLLKLKIGPLPPALVLAQAANESAWGTSRFARQGNNLFGQWCFTPGCGLAPLQRNAGASHEVEAFGSVAEGIHSYFTNLNSNKSYAGLRQIRRCLNRQELPLRGRALAAGLSGYSARGNHYVQELRAMMRINRLEEWASHWWGDTALEHPCFGLVQADIDAPDPILVVAEASSTDPQAKQKEEPNPMDETKAPAQVLLEEPAGEQTAPSGP